MPHLHNDKWVKKQLDAWPPDGYRLTLLEVVEFLNYRNDICTAMSACYNYGFRRGRNYERNTARRKRAQSR